LLVIGLFIRSFTQKDKKMKATIQRFDKLPVLTVFELAGKYYRKTDYDYAINLQTNKGEIFKYKEIITSIKYD
jgi:hypothetical protein